MTKFHSDFKIELQNGMTTLKTEKFKFQKRIRDPLIS